MKRLLIANRGEIALRVIRTAREMGIETVAIYSDQDRNAPYVDMADSAYHMPGDTYNETYLNMDRILEIAQRSQADAIHPGYGFLSENDEFAKRVIAAGLTWVGPHPEALFELGDKITARRFAVRADVTPVPGISEPVSDIHTLINFCNEFGYPVMMKRADGGGGHGITIVRTEDDLRSFFMSHDSLQGGDLDKYFIEKFVSEARHVETQCGRDSKGNFTVYSTRDCSVQRRNQKLIEEAPAPFLTPEVDEKLHLFSKRLFEAAQYVGLGTCEFMVTPRNDVYFLEVNPRLQVEHTVSEEVCGLDLVREQLVIADGGELTVPDSIRGHSFELRITSEDPEKNLTPSSGVIEKLSFPSGPGIRVDFGVAQGDTISPKYDSMMGKLVVTAANRDEAIARVHRAISEFSIEGISTPIALYDEIFAHDDFTARGKSGRFNVTTKWLENTFMNEHARTMRAGQPASVLDRSVNSTEPSELGSSRANSQISSRNTQNTTFVVEVDDRRMKISVPEYVIAAVSTSHRPLNNRKTQPLRGSGLNTTGSADTPSDGGLMSSNGEIKAPMQAVVTRVNVAVDQSVNKGDLLVVLESMKMENYVYAPISGVIDEIYVGPADGVDAGEALLKINISENSSSERSDATANEKPAVSSGQNETADSRELNDLNGSGEANEKEAN
ncbi:ATP-grasp domain-containing protein [Alloscardovia theropitheci]|uniref:biotin carboxylase n=1 Tax=Alloscardovia theropitheci TaxID=2496842 RepID=A0A4R0QWJ0_9BIFI|nr:biotin carboxylase N-terminal domain-containing protein [Alloscardovia theropitheci]TCD53641.1 ATP-grasp domain-containing protein [Alloscardovia theropitheci]